MKKSTKFSVSAVGSHILKLILPTCVTFLHGRSHIYTFVLFAKMIIVGDAQWSPIRGFAKRAEVYVTPGETFDVCSNVLYDGELQLCSLTSEDVWSFLRDTQRFAVAVETYGNYRALAC